DRHGMVQCLEVLAYVACERAAHVTAARLMGYTSVQRLRLTAPLAEGDRSRMSEVERAVGRALGSATAERARQEGRSMPSGEAYELGQAVAGGHAVSDPVPPSHVLTRRETQVAMLVASGRTNRQIGIALGIAEKTAEVHLQHVMAKLEARNRAEVAA